MDAWIPVLSSIVAAATAIIAQKIATGSVWKQQLGKYKIEESLAVMECAQKIKRHFEGMGGSLSGRKEPEVNSPEDEKKEAMRRDKELAAHLSALSGALDELKMHSVRLSALGSDKVRKACDDLDGLLYEYFVQALEQAQRDGKFIAANHHAADEKIKTSIDYLTDSIREDLKC
ncbi:hypothetical protein [Thermophilibacter immobilis]|uniref:Uncharacterized protein n=1 Tax=Thermophilibacter immobilis TaxID=2779519 RepID=A0A7S7M7U3_9ACTN|nr:hypothetical protein [Thermophilibacter immobilis]QOY60342.1 hypothetical protein INP52_08005 [Thermophilibacter immobilis]